MAGASPQAGALVVVGDDTWSEGTQVPADSRFLSQHLYIPVVEPATFQEIKDWVGTAWSYPGLVESFPLDSQATFSYCFSNFMGAWLPRAEWRRCGLYHPSIKVKTAIRASALV